MPSLLSTVKDLGRLREIAGVLARYGFEELVQNTGLGSLVSAKRAARVAELSRAQRIRSVLQELGPSFIKLGQILSTRPDLIPDDIVSELKQLQERVPPVPFEEVRTELEEQLGAPVSEVFSEFECTPMASASIGQVYRAKLRDPDGDLDVVVKVQRPNIANTIARDVDLLYWLAHAVERSSTELAVHAPVRLVAEFDRVIRAELDYAEEADNAARFTANFQDLPTVRFPRVYRQASARKVLTLEYLPGRNVFDAVADGMSGKLIAQRSIEVMVKMIFEHGLFHADPHPGNILILGTNEEPVIGLVDLGQVGHLSPKVRDRLIDLLVAVGRDDPRAIADALYGLGTPTKRIDRNAFEAEVARLSEKYLRKQLGQIQFAGLLQDLVSGSVRYGLEVPPDLVIVGKSIMTVEGIGRQLYPELDLASELRPYIGDIMAVRYSPERLTSDLLHTATRFAAAAGDFPTQAEDILEDLRQGRLSIQTRQPTLEMVGERLGKRLSTAATVSALILGGSLMIASDKVLYGTIALGAAAAWGFLRSTALAFGKFRKRGS